LPSLDFSDLLSLQVYNALFILRAITKHFIETDCQKNLFYYFDPQEANSDRLMSMCGFVDALYRTAIFVPVHSFTYGIHLEVLNILLALLAVQMCVDEPILISTIYSIFMHRLE
jgi:hypothetical protein